MKKSFSARRVPRKIGGDDDDEEEPRTGSPADSQAAGSVVKRPVKARKSSSFRRSLATSTADEDEGLETSVVTPKHAKLSRVALERNASSRASLNAPVLSARSAHDDDDRPSYSATYLQELKNSTPSTPQNFQSHGPSDIEDISTGTHDLDIASKLGSALARYRGETSSSLIPSAAEIAEKKARRARLAQEQQAEEYISLDVDDPELDDDDENVTRDAYDRLILKPKDKYGLSESRLIRDDEDIMEDFDDFTEDGKIALGRKAEAEARQRRRQEMAAQIAEAEGGSDSDSDASERERNAAFEAAQTRHGAYAKKGADSTADAQPQTPSVITPLPTLEGAIERLRKQLADMQNERAQKLREMETLRREKIRLAEDEVRIQRSLTETGQKFEALRKEKGIESSAPALPPSLTVTVGHVDVEKEKGMLDDNPGEADDYTDEDEAQAGGFAGLGFGASRQGLGGTAGLGMVPATRSDGSDDT